MNRVLTGALFILISLAVACTSSNTPTGTQSNSGYDSQFREQTRSTQQNYATGGQLAEPQGDPPLTIMLMSMETGDVYPGEDYYVYAVVDNPMDRDDIEYVWSVAQGDISEVPESERGRLISLVEEEYKTGGSTGPVAQQPEAGEGPVGTEQSMPEAGGEVKQRGPGMGAEATPPGAMRPGATAEPGIGPEGERIPETFIEDEPDPDAEQIGEELGRYGSNLISERYVVGGPEEDPAGDAQGEDTVGTDELTDEEETEAEEDGLESEEDTTVPEIAREVFEGSEAAAREVGTAAANVVEESVESEAVESIEDDAVLSGDPDRGYLRSEYRAWQETNGESRRRPLGSFGEPEESERLTAEESYDLETFVTDEPYVLWTPSIPGDVSIFMKVQYKGEDLTDATELPVTVRLKDASVVISDDFPDIVREDESVYVRLDAENIPAFNKGLFTISFDQQKLSFRDAELGEFFDDAPAASLYYAQPDKSDGKVLLAIDANTGIIDLAGDGALVYVKFKAKEDISDRSMTQLALSGDSSARYILNRESENVLPLPVEHPVFRTEVTMPPELGGYTRENTPGTAQPGTTGTGGTRPGGTAPTPAGSARPGASSGGGGQYASPGGTAPAGSGTPTHGGEYGAKAPERPDVGGGGDGGAGDTDAPAAGFDAKSFGSAEGGEETAEGGSTEENTETAVPAPEGAAKPGENTEPAEPEKTDVGEKPGEGEKSESGDETGTQGEEEPEPEPEPEPTGEDETAG